MWPLLLTGALAGLLGLVTAVSMLRLSPTARRQDLTVDDEGSELHAQAPRVVALPLIALALGIGITVLGGLVILLERASFVQHWDETVERWAATHAGDVATSVLVGITHLGDTLTIVLVVVVTAVFLIVTRRDWQAAGFLLTVALGQWLITNLIKLAYDRARPSLDPLTNFSGASFPSGHSSAAAATYLAVALVLAGYVHHRMKAVLIGMAVGLAVAVACSRALLGVHWFTDVLGGVVLGWIWCLICWYAFAPHGGMHALWGPFGNRSPNRSTSSSR